MPKSNFTTKIICVITLTVLLCSQAAWGGYDSCLRAQEADQADPTIIVGMVGAMGRFPLEQVDPVETITTFSGKTLSVITMNLEDKDDFSDQEVMAALYELSDPRQWYFLITEQRDYALKLSVMNRNEFAEELEKYSREPDTFADLHSYEEQKYGIGHNLSWLVSIQNIIWTLVNTAVLDEQEKAHFENVRGNASDGVYQPYDLRRYSEIVGRLSQVDSRDEEYNMFYNMFYKQLMGIQFQRELYYRWWDTAPKPRSHLLMPKNIPVGTDQDLIKAVKDKLNVSILAAAVVEPDKDNRERLATDLKTYWGFDEVLVVESISELNQMLQEEKYKNLKITLIINNTEEAFDLLTITITPQTIDIRKPIREYLRSI